MARTYGVESDSPTSARVLEPVVLWTSDDGTRRLAFLPHIHENPNDSRACVSGELRYQRKAKDAAFTDERGLQLNRLKNEQWVKYELRSSAARELYRTLDDLYAAHAECGVPQGVATIVSLDGEFSAELDALGTDQVSELLGALVRRSASSAGVTELIKQLGQIGSESLAHLRDAAGVAGLVSALEQWSTIAPNRERAWQKFLKENPWILAQAFCQPVVLYRPEAPVSSPTLSRSDQRFVDFVYTNALTRNLLLVEIKSPSTKLVTERTYRGDQIFAPSAELVGAVAQISAYRHSVKQHAHALLRGSERAELRSDPLCVVVAGETSTLTQDGQSETFEQYRRELRNIEILTFDELKSRAEGMLKLIRDVADSNSQEDA